MKNQNNINNKKNSYIYLVHRVDCSYGSRLDFLSNLRVHMTEKKATEDLQSQAQNLVKDMAHNKNVSLFLYKVNTVTQEKCILAKMQFEAEQKK